MLTNQEKIDRCKVVRQLCEEMKQSTPRTDTVNEILQLAFVLTKSFSAHVSESIRKRIENFDSEYQTYQQNNFHLPINAASAARFALLGIEAELKSREKI